MFSLNLETGDLIWNDSVVAQLSVSEAQVLQCLMDSRGELVTKEMLLDVGWPNKVVQPNSLTVAIKNIRKALANIAIDVSIETRHRKGYIYHSANTADNSVEHIPSEAPPGYSHLTSNNAEPTKHEQPWSDVYHFVINLIFYAAVITLIFWSLFISSLDSPLICHKISNATLCGFSELNSDDRAHLDERVKALEGTYLYGYDKQLDKLQIHKMD